MNTSIFISEESARCMLCQNAPCTKACASGQPDRFIRSLRFDNISQSMKWIEECSSDDLAAAESACIHYDSPIRISALAEAVRNSGSASHQKHLPSLEIKFCGLTCENPFFLASSAVCTNYEMVAKAFDAGWAGVFYKTICFQEINEVSPRFDAVHSSKRGDFYGFRNMEQLSENPVEMDFDILNRLKKNYPSKIVVASIMGQTEVEWIELAKMAEKSRSRCCNVQVCTSVMQFGYRIIDDLISGLQAYMASHGISQLSDLVGEKIKDFSPASELDRETMVFPKINRELCIGCGRCSISCYDGGHQAIIFDETRKPKIVGQKCVGCHLCVHVCPTGAISSANRIMKIK